MAPFYPVADLDHIPNRKIIACTVSGSLPDKGFVADRTLHGHFDASGMAAPDVPHREIEAGSSLPQIDLLL